MMEVIQIFKARDIFEKANYTPENRRKFDDLNETMESANGFVRDNVLYLPIAYKNQKDIETANLIIIQDIEGFNPFLIEKNDENLHLPNWMKGYNKDILIQDNQLVFGFNQLRSPKKFELFRISKSQTDCFDLFIDYTSNCMTIGIPERENHKICKLKKGKPIRYKTNGKSDFTMTSGKKRTFQEFNYIIEVIGQVDKIEYLELNQIQMTKGIPYKDCKVIDERKILK